MNPPVITYGPGLYPVLEDLDQQPDAPDRLFELVGRESSEDRSDSPTEALSLQSPTSTTTPPEPVETEERRESRLEHRLGSDVVFLAAYLGEASSWEGLRVFVERLRSSRYLLCSVLIGPHEEFLDQTELSGTVDSVCNRSDFVLPVNTSRIVNRQTDRVLGADSSDWSAQLVTKILRKLQNRLDKSSSRVEGLQNLIQMNRREKLRFLRICVNGMV